MLNQFMREFAIPVTNVHTKQLQYRGMVNQFMKEFAIHVHVIIVNIQLLEETSKDPC